MSEPCFFKVYNVQLLGDELIKLKNRNIVTMEELKIVVPLTRSMFTKEYLGEVEAKEPEHTGRSGML